MSSDKIVGREKHSRGKIDLKRGKIPPLGPLLKYRLKLMDINLCS